MPVGHGCPSATRRPAGGRSPVRPGRWRGHATPPRAGHDILESVAARFSLEVAYRDLKDVVGAGRQQVRRMRASVGAFPVCLWTFTLTEGRAWQEIQTAAERLLDLAA